MVFLGKILILMVVLYVIETVDSFQATKSWRVSGLAQQGVGALSMGEKRRMTVRIMGKSVYENLFRVEVKKELNFFRGCTGILSNQMGWLDFAEAPEPPSDEDVVYLTAEGKESQLKRFLDWLDQMQTPLEKRKVSFQGPPTVVAYSRDEVVWSDYTGDIKGFTVAGDMPEAVAQVSPAATDGSIIEAKSMAGTDESV